MTDEELRKLLDDVGERPWRYWIDELGGEDVFVISEVDQVSSPERMIGLLTSSRTIARELLEARAKIKRLTDEINRLEAWGGVDWRE